MINLFGVSFIAIFIKLDFMLIFCVFLYLTGQFFAIIRETVVDVLGYAAGGSIGPSPAEGAQSERAYRARLQT
jgi:hypothetical protein